MEYGPQALREVMGQYNAPGAHHLLVTYFELHYEAQKKVGGVNPRVAVWDK